jgi:hypothetical protein
MSTTNVEMVDACNSSNIEFGMLFILEVETFGGLDALLQQF